MHVLAIDPGPLESAYVRWNVSEERIEDMGLIPNHKMFAVIRENRDACVAIEMIASYGMAVGTTVFETCVWIGQFMREARKAPVVRVDRVFRRECKTTLCHNSRAKDSNIRQALIDRYGLPGKKATPGKLYGVKKDIWAALAVAVTYTERERLNKQPATEGES